MRKTTRLLIADDGPRARHGMRAMLATQPEIEVIGEAANGKEAVQLVEMSHPDVVLLDVLMPVMDGLEATRLIKRRWPEVRVVVMTMYSSYGTDALAAGADAFLIKGRSQTELLKAILGPLR